MLTNLLSIFAEVILPILLLIAVGAFFHRRFQIHLGSLNRLTIYLLVPSFLFVKIYKSELSLIDMWQITYGVFVPVFVMGFLMFAVLRKTKLSGNELATMIVASVVFNAGNFGLPVAELYYGSLGKELLRGMRTPDDGVAVQALIIMLSNVSVWLFGYGAIRLGQGHGLRGILGFFRLPMIYVLFAAFALQQSGTKIPTAIFQPLNWLAAATVPIMLLTLGAQLAHDAHLPNWRLVSPVLILKLLVLPALTAVFVWRLGLWPWPGAQIIIASAAPTAVNTLVLSIELDGDARLAASCVFWTTLLSAITVTGILALVGFAAR
ncbi:MAG: AEC family transporter [Pirellulales bacterium]